jgi:hypothetical protein
VALSRWSEASKTFVTIAAYRLVSDRDTSAQIACDEPIEYPLLLSGLDDAVLQRGLLELAFSCFAEFAFGVRMRRIPYELPVASVPLKVAVRSRVVAYLDVSNLFRSRKEPF